MATPSIRCRPQAPDRTTYPTRAAARADIFDRIEASRHFRRRHSTLGQASPAEFERAREGKVQGSEYRGDSKREVGERLGHPIGTNGKNRRRT